MSIPAAFMTHADARKAGWFSRRHQSDAEHRSAQETWRADRADKAEREQMQRDETEAWKKDRAL